MLPLLLALLASGTRLRVAEALGLGALETWRPAVPGQRKLRRGVGLDLTYSYLVPVIIYPAVYWMLPLLRGMPHGPCGQLGFAAQVVAAVVVGDFVAYWKHRLLHTRLLWRFHAAHHGSVEIDWLSNERVHPVESVLNALLQAASLVLLGFTPAAIGLAVAVRQTYSAFTHANVRLSYGPLGRLFVSPHHHRWHHSDDPAMAGRNFANLLAVFDVLGGTWAARDGEPASFGIRGERTPDGFVAQMIAPFAGMMPRRTAVVPAGVIQARGA